MEYMNGKHLKHYRRVYIRTILQDIWDMEYTPLALLVGLLSAGYYLLVSTKLLDYLVGGF